MTEPTEDARIAALEAENAKLRQDNATHRAFASQLEDAMRQPTTADHLQQKLDLAEADNKRLQHEAEASDAAFKQCERDYQRVQRELIQLRADRRPRASQWLLMVAVVALGIAGILNGVNLVSHAARITALEERSK